MAKANTERIAVVKNLQNKFRLLNRKTPFFQFIARPHLHEKVGPGNK
jgi:hypothetical protein